MKTKLISTSAPRVSINIRRLKIDAFEKSRRSVIRTLRPIIEKRVAREQARMIADFVGHPVTQELLGGNRSANISGTLGGSGNLFSFIGFSEGENPIAPILEILRRPMRSRISKGSKVNSFIANIDAPSKNDVYATAQVGWMGGRSWLDGIENGIAGLNHYLYDAAGGLNNSASGTGLQSKNKTRSVTQSRTSYVSSIMADFKRNLSKS